MSERSRIIDYLTETYHPSGLIVYGSYADGSNNENSDFDALVITDGIRKHDTSTVGGTVLDVFVYPAATFGSDPDPRDYIQIYDGKIILDHAGTAKRLQERVRAFVDRAPQKTRDEIMGEIAWCEKMLSRTVRGDAEGYYRWHWLLTDSLEIYTDVKGQYYFGPKKTLRMMRQTDAESYRICSQALSDFSRDSLAAWVGCLKALSETEWGRA